MPITVEWLQSEVRNQHSLLGTRMNWYVTSQSFLIAGLGITSGPGNAFHWLSAGPFPLIPTIGLTVSAMLWCVLLATIASIQQLRVRERQQLRRDNPELADLWYGRTREAIHFISLAPLGVLPGIFLVFWLAVWRH